MKDDNDKIELNMTYFSLTGHHKWKSALSRHVHAKMITQVENSILLFATMIIQIWIRSYLRRIISKQVHSTVMQLSEKRENLNIS